MTVVGAAVAGRLISRPMAPTAAAASVAAILRDTFNLLFVCCRWDEVDWSGQIAAETRHVSASGPEARMTIESRPNQSSRVRRSLTSRLPSRARMTPRRRFSARAGGSRSSGAALPSLELELDTDPLAVGPEPTLDLAGRRARAGLSNVPAVVRGSDRGKPKRRARGNGREQELFRSNLIVYRACPRAGRPRNGTPS